MLSEVDKILELLLKPIKHVITQPLTHLINSRHQFDLDSKLIDNHYYLNNKKVQFIQNHLYN